MRTKSITLLLLFLMAFFNTAAQDWPNLKRFKADNSEIIRLQKPVEVVFMGNSITEGWMSHDPEFFNKNGFINRGISGQTTPQMLIRFRQDVVDLQPKVVVILAGTNDIAGNTGPSTIKMIQDNLASMAEIATANGIKVVLSSILPVYDYPWKPGLKPAEKIIKINNWMKAYAEKHGHIYLDYHSHLSDKRKGMKPIYANDEVHPTSEGYEVMRPLAEAAIQKAMTK
ncbi:SGNH/GDSL hydrolase family protein [Zhouia amylolytica]|nr:SGNH/GDSL hydrolase family protein [Zhouia amylolytica]